MKIIRTTVAAVSVAVFFGLAAQQAKAQTTQWVRIPTDPEHTPAGRETAVMVYDEKREVILMHGGLAPDGYSYSDTWEWDGETWRLVSIDGPPRKEHRMAYDVARDRTVLYGGRSVVGWKNGYINEDELWEWDGASWSHIETGSAEPLIIFTMVYDRERRKIIRHGGVANQDFASSDPATYEWDGANWTQIAGGSFTRGGQRATYDSARGRTVMFGGTSRTDIPRAHFTDGTWEFDGTDWAQVADTGPLARVLHEMTFDSHRGVTILYGGSDLTTTRFGETWEWDGVRWKEKKVSGPDNIRVMFAMAFDPKRRKVVLFGGSPERHSKSGYLNETWEYGLIPLRISETLRQAAGTIEIHWTGEAPPYQLQSRSGFGKANWLNEGEPTETSNAVVQAVGKTKFFRVLSLYGN